MQAQHAVSMAAGPDGDPIQLAGEVAATQTATALDEDDTGGVGSAFAENAEDGLRPTSPLVAPGAEKCRLATFESIYGQWKQGFRSNSDIDASLGDIWLQLFLQWPRWGLDSIHHQLHQVLDMDRDPSPSSTRPTIPETAVPEGDGQLRVPFHVVFDRWCGGLIADSTITSLYGDRWMELLMRMRDELLPACRQQLAELVEWDADDPMDPCNGDSSDVVVAEFGAGKS